VRGEVANECHGERLGRGTLRLGAGGAIAGDGAPLQGAVRAWPDQGRTEFAGPDIVICTLEHSFTPAERKLAEMGEHQRLRDTRLYFQHASETDFRETVERIIGRRVRAFISGTDTKADVSSEVFYLESDGAGPAPPADAD
jgi:uncharacterized protein YbcI